MLRALSLLTFIAVAGCDAFSEADPAWTRAGAVATFDYAPGPDSLKTHGPVPQPLYRAVPAGERALEMVVVASANWRRTDRHVEWRDAGASAHPYPQFHPDVPLPLFDDDIEVVEDGVAVVVDVDCYGGGWLGGGSSGRLSYVRVPNQAGTVQTYGNCERSSDLTTVTSSASGPETVTVPAGTFSAIRVESPIYAGGTLVEWWSWEVGLVRLDALNEAGVLRGRFVRSAGG